MAEAEILGNVEVMTDWQNAPGSANAVLADDHGAVVQGRVLEENILDKPLVNRSIDNVAGGHDVVELLMALNDDEGTDVLLAHRHAGHDDGHDVALQLVAVVSA